MVALLLSVSAAAYWFGMDALTFRQYELAGAALERYDYAAASDHLNRYLSQRPADPAALLLKAQTARRMNKLDDAERLLKSAEKNGAPLDGLDQERQLLSLQAGGLNLADRWVTFCESHPADPKATLAMEAIFEGSLKTQHRSLAEWAVNLWLKARTGALDQAHGLCWRGRMSWLFTRAVPQALVDLQDAVDLAPEHPLARAYLASALLEHDPRQAAAHVEWLRQHRPNDLEVRFLAARLHRNLGQPEKAASLLDELLAAEPDNFQLLLERGKVALDLKLPEDAEPWLKRAQAQIAHLGAANPGPLREVHLLLAERFRMSDRLEDAERHMNQVREIERAEEKMREEWRKKTGP